MNARLKHLKNCIASIPQTDYPMHSRIHPLRSFSFASTQCYVKRDDELGFGISGSKIRKYRSLIPFLLNHSIQEVIVIGSAYSNHVLSLVQLLIENGLIATLFLRGDPNRPVQGNAFLTSLFISPTSIHWFLKSEWKDVESKAHAYAQQQNSAFVLPEGGFCAEALPGALTLALDLLKNEEEKQLNFDHIFIEAGTGFTASALILALYWMGHPTCVHVIPLAEDEQAFLSRLQLCHHMFMDLIQCTLPFPENFRVHALKNAQGFGKTNSFVFDNIAQIARQEGFLTDPIYSVKLFIASKQILTQEKINGNVLIHHSGGSLTLMGFQQQLHKTKLVDTTTCFNAITPHP